MPVEKIQAVALWDYTASDDTEISFSAGDIIEIVELHNEDWYEGIFDEKQGFFPGNHVKLVTDDPNSIHIPPVVINDAPASETSSALTNVVNLAIAAQSPILQLSVDSKETSAASNYAGDNIDSESEKVATPELSPQAPAKGDSSDEEEEFPLPPGWCIVSTSDNLTYYWNEETQETSWTLPTSLNRRKSNGADLVVGISPTKTSTPPANPATNRIENIPSELIRREGGLSYKIKKEFGGIEPRKAQYWHKTWGIVCVGYLVLYKEEPAKLLKKKSTCLPVQVINLESIIIKKESKESSKKSFISLETKSGAVFYLTPNNETEVNDWIATITDSTRENSTAAEYENGILVNEGTSNQTLVLSKIFVEANRSYVQPRKQDSVVSNASKPSLARKTSFNKTVSGIKPSTESNETEPSEEIPSKSTVKSMLNSFFFKKGSSEKKEKAKDIPPEAIVFGGTLENLAKYSKSNVPIFLKNSVEYVESSGGLESQGIYRLSGNASIVQKFRTQLNQNNDQDLYIESMDVNVVAALLKLFFRELQMPVIPFKMYHQFINASKIADYDTKLIEIKNLVQALPKVHYDVLDFLMRHLVKVAARSEVNKMETSNLAIVFGPSLLRLEEKGEADMQQQIANMMNMSSQNSLIENIITQAGWLFDGNPN